jgi:outer membrane protein assembly factor BamB
LALDGSVFVLASPSNKPVSSMGGELCGYSAAAGRLLWKQPKVGSGWGSSVVPWTSGGKNYLIANSDGGTFCVEPEKGTVLWQVPGGGSSTAAISGDTMVVHSGKVRAFKISPQKADLLWEVPMHGDRFGSPLIYQDRVYFEGAYESGFGCLDLKTGAVKWCQKNETGHCSSPVVADGKLFAVFGSGDLITGALRMYKPGTEKFEELGRFIPKASNCTSPVIADGRLYLRLVDGVACYDLVAR